MSCQTFKHSNASMFLDVHLIIVVVEGWISPERVGWLATVPPGVPEAARHSPGASVRVSAEGARGWAPPPALLLPHPGAAKLLCTEVRYRRTSDHVLTTSLFCILLIPIVRLVDLLLALKTFKYKKDMKDIYNIVSMAHLVSKKIRMGGMATELWIVTCAAQPPRDTKLCYLNSLSFC